MFTPKTIRPVLTGALCLFAVPAFAQDAACNGLGANGQWIGGAEASSDISTADSYQEQMALVLSGNQYVSLFSVSAPTTVRLEAAGRGSGDPQIDLIDATGAIILSDDDSGGNGAARAEVALDPGTYCMSLNSFDGAPMTAFVRMGRLEQEPLTEGVGETSGVIETGNASGGGDCAAATPLGVFSGSLTATGSVDANPYWGFSLAEPTPITITAQNEDADPLIILYDATETYISENDDFDGLNSRLDVANPLPAGDYCIEMQALNDTGLPIDLNIEVYDPQAVLMGQIDRGEVAPPLDGSVEVTELGSVSGRLRADAQIGENASWFSVEVPENGLILIEAIAGSSDGDPWLALFDDLGRQVSINDDYGDGLDSRLAEKVSAGSYMLAVKQVGGANDGLVRMVFERYVPAP